ncbi:hypothetical protein [Bailinhaonella thermotolerans]|uniref:Ig-like domain-containing protein n=1 Tax=Bailinhaonella thermotolerans TaxID=1070861 RepID=A0A3A4ARZ0_9ACTN|nr:hypothetical protein [Bailinhaonella thermotolerans]RJL32638.1 hypothetical protein D5H75_14115 [Bailinhaonella thermotolerans]
MGVAGYRLTGHSRASELGVWEIVTAPGGNAAGALRFDMSRLAAEGALDRLVEAVAEDRDLGLPGLLPIADLVSTRDQVWLLTAGPAAPALTDLLAADEAGELLFDAGHAATVLDDVAQTLIAVHAAGLAHGAVQPANVVIGPDGTALLAELGLAAAVRDVIPGRAGDVAGWAAMTRTLAAAWAADDPDCADLFRRCAEAAEARGLTAARGVLAGERETLPSGFPQRAGLAEAAEWFTARQTASPAGSADEILTVADTADTADDQGATGPEYGRAEAAEPYAAGPRSGGRTGEPRGAAHGGGGGGHGSPDNGSPDIGFPDSGSREGGSRSGGARHAAARHGAPLDGGSQDGGSRDGGSRDGQGDLARTLLLDGEQSRRAEPYPDRERPAERPRAAGEERRAGSEEDERDLVMRFGPGIPDDWTAARIWRAGREHQAAPRRRPARRGRKVAFFLVALSLVIAAGVAFWLTRGPELAVTGVSVQGPRDVVGCDSTTDLVGVIHTNGRPGQITYQWLRNDGQRSGELVQSVGGGQRSVRVHLRWAVRGTGELNAVATLRILTPKPAEAQARFFYRC